MEEHELVPLDRLLVDEAESEISDREELQDDIMTEDVLLIYGKF